MNCPNCDHPIPKAALKSEAARLVSEACEVPRGGKRKGAGRKKCQCGECPACEGRRKASG